MVLYKPRSLQIRKLDTCKSAFTIRLEMIAADEEKNDSCIKVA